MAAPSTLQRPAFPKALVSDPPNPSQVLRVNQLDAIYLDNELISALKAQFSRIFRYLPYDVLMKYDIEIDSLLQSLLFYFSLYSNRPSPGDLLQNLTLKHELTKKKKYYYFIMIILSPYLWKKWLRFMTDRGYSLLNLHNNNNNNNTSLSDKLKYKLYQFCNQLSILIRIVSLSHFLYFLYYGKYRTVIERLLNIQLKYLNPNLNRMITFDFMNQQIVWNALSVCCYFLF